MTISLFPNGVLFGDNICAKIKEDLLKDFNLHFAWQGSFAIADKSVDGCIVSDKFPTYEADISLINMKYLNYYFRTKELTQQAQNLSKGAAAISKLTLNPSQFWDLTIPLPPLEEQRRIVAKIEELERKIEEVRLLRQKIFKETETILGGGVERILEYLIKKYECKSLFDLVDPNRGISYGVVQTGEYFENGVPTLRAGDLQQFRVILTNVKCIDPQIEAKYKRTRLCGNELLLRIRGGLGEVAVCPPQMIGGNVSREIAVIPFTDKVLPEYGMYILSSPSNQTAMTQKLRGSSYVGINLKDVRKISIPVPPLAEQQSTVVYLNELRTKVDTMRRLRENAIKELDALLPSILDKAFKGEL